MGAKRRLRATGKRPIAREAYDRHNRHKRETWPEIKKATAPERPFRRLDMD